MTFKQSITTCMGSKYLFCFKGRASRSEYWWFTLFMWLVNMAGSFIFPLLPTMLGMSVAFAVALVLLPPSLGVAVRRFHDRNLSGWWLILPILMLGVWGVSGARMDNVAANLLSLSMCICYLVILCLPGQHVPNRFGDVPH